jgi:hypothetical protein
MPFIAPVVAYVDGRGHLLCEEHQDRAKGESIPMHADNSALYGEACDCCGKVFDESIGRLKIRVDYRR